MILQGCKLARSMVAKLRVALIFLVYGILRVSADQFREDVTNEMSQLVIRFKQVENENLGVNFLQNHFKQLGENTTLRLVTITELTQIAEKIEVKISDMGKGLDSLRSTVEGAGIGSLHASCCDYKEISDGNDKVICSIGRFPLSIVDNDFKTARELASARVTRMYVGHKAGSFLHWPAKNMSSVDEPETCRSFDPRLSPWYVSALRPASGREVVLLVDISYPSSQQAAAVAMLIKMLLGAFDTRDKIGVALFGSEASVSSPMSCLQSSVVQANPAVLKEIENFISSALIVSQPQGLFNVTKVFVEALTKFTTSSTEKSVFVFSSGWNVRTLDFPPHLERIAKFHVMVLTDQTQSEEETIWKNLARVTSGTYLRMSDRDLSYFPDHLQQGWLPSDKLVKFTMPYYDFSGMGVLFDVTTACCKSSTCSPDSFIGIAGISLLASQFFAIPLGLEISDVQYYFVIDSNGITYYHPMLTYPTAWRDKTMAIHIESLETSLEFKQIASQMMRPMPSSPSRVIERKCVLVNMSLPRGDRQLDGSKLVQQVVTYMWTWVKGSEFVVALVVPGNLTEGQVQPPSGDHLLNLQFKDLSPSPNTSKPLYYRLDSYEEDLAFCINVATVAVAKISSVKLSPDKFQPTPFSAEMTPTKREQIVNYLYYPAYTPPTDIFVSVDAANLARRYIIASDVMDKFWSSDNSEGKFYTLLRYVGFEDGTFRSYPGHLVNPMYDPRVRPWYNLAKAHEGKSVLTPPYLDAATLTPVITLAKTLYIVNNNTQKVAGVMGVDFTLEHIGVIINEEISTCKQLSMSRRCFVLDASGDILYYPEMSDSVSQHRTYHIIEKEPVIAASMINQGVMVKESCIARAKPGSETLRMTHEYYYYTIVASSYREYVAYPGEDDCADFTLVPVNQTNIYLLLTKSFIASDVNCAVSSSKIALASSSTSLSSTPPCTAGPGAHEPPCFKARPCLDSLLDKSSLRLCPSPGRIPSYPIELEAWVKKRLSQSLPPCVDPLCTTLNYTQCSRLGCVISKLNSDGTTKPKEKWTCIYRPKPSPVHEDGDTETWVIPVAVVVPVVVVATVVAIAVLVLLLRRRSRRRAENEKKSVATPKPVTLAPVKKQDNYWF